MLQLRSLPEDDPIPACAAHRLSTIARMDRIVVLDRGCVVEEGRPDELVEQDGLFSRLWKRQTAGFIPEEIGSV